MWTEVLQWFAETDDIGTRTWEHVKLSYAPVIAAIFVAVPAGVYIGHRRRFEIAVVTVANVGRALPSFGVLALALPLSIRFGLGLGFWPSFAALFLLSLPPLLMNTYVGVKDVEAETVEAARGVGMSEMQVVRRVEVPLALPLIAAGVRIAALQSIATASLAALVAGGGYGYYILLGMRTGRSGPLLGGAILVALLALLTEAGFALATKRFMRSPDDAGSWAAPRSPQEASQVGRAGGMA